MRIPKKSYRDKVKMRLDAVKMLFADKEKLFMILRGHKIGGERVELKRKIEWLTMLLERDVPALLAAFESENKSDAGILDWKSNHENRRTKT